jgi:hypothetical protein
MAKRHANPFDLNATQTMRGNGAEPPAVKRDSPFVKRSGGPDRTNLANARRQAIQNMTKAESHSPHKSKGKSPFPFQFRK